MNVIIRKKTDWSFNASLPFFNYRYTFSKAGRNTIQQLPEDECFEKVSKLLVLNISL